MRYVEADYDVQFDLPTPTETAPDDVQPNATWGLDRIDQPRPAALLHVQIPPDRRHLRAYVLDTGIRMTHQDLGGRASYGRDTVDTVDDCLTSRHSSQVSRDIVHTLTDGVMADVDGPGRDHSGRARGPLEE